MFPSIEVIVTETEYHSYGDPTSFWQRFTAQMLDRRGGINHSVMPGVYEYRIRPRLKGFKIEESLIPKQ